MKNVYGVNNPREEVLVIETPSDVMKNDAGNKKSAIYHPPVKHGKSNAQERKEYKEKCGDVRTIKLGMPMKWDDFLALSDNTKCEYLRSIFAKYPGIDHRTICSVFSAGLKINEIKLEISRLGFTFDNVASSYIQTKIAKKIAKEKQEETDSRKAKAKKPERILYSQIRKLPNNEALEYFENVYDYYNHMLSLADFADLCNIRNTVIRKYFINIGFDLDSRGSFRTREARPYRKAFREEMLGVGDTEEVKTEKVENPVVASEPEEEKTDDEPADHVTISNSVTVNSIDVCADAGDIDGIVDLLKSFSGTIKIRIEKV